MSRSLVRRRPVRRSVPAANTLVRKLMKLHEEASRARVTALEKARDAGRLLLGLERSKMLLIARQAGVSERTAYVYIQIAQNWREIAARIATSLQHAAKPLSIRGALALIAPPTTPKPRVDTFDLELDCVVDPEELARALTAFRGRPVEIKVRLQRDSRQADERQARLPFD